MEVRDTPGNDDFASATELLGGVGKADAVDTLYATGQTGEPSHLPGANLTQWSSVWYTFTPHADATLTVSVDPDPQYSGCVSLYTGSSVGALSRVNSAYNGLAAHVTSGTAYHIVVGGSRGQHGS